VVRQQEKTPPRLAMIESQRRFGPAAIAVLLLIAGAVAFAIFYNSQEPNLTPANTNPSVTKAAETRGPSPASQKAERAAVSNKGSNTKREVSNREQASERANEKKKEANDRDRAAELVSEKKTEAKDRERANEKKKETVPMNSRSAVLKWQKAANAQQPRPRRSVNAPTLRLPNPELGNNLSAPSSESGTRAFGSATSAPKFFRAADGTLTVKFSDGSTRVVKPGERTARP
jgi:hypothetical protein